MIDKLRQYLNSQPASTIQVTPKLEVLLANAWANFSGSDAESMTANKLRRATFSGKTVVRVENLEWNAPFITFDIERHGPTVLGSVKKPLQTWTLDVVRRTASCDVTGRYRLDRPTQKKIDSKLNAENLVDTITKQQPDDRLKWKKDGAVQILTGKIYPDESAVKPTVAGRRKRLIKALSSLLSAHGWVVSGTNTYKKESR